MGTNERMRRLYAHHLGREERVLSSVRGTVEAGRAAPWTGLVLATERRAPAIAAAARAYRDAARLGLAPAEHQHDRHLLHFGVVDLAPDLLLARVQLRAQPCGAQGGDDLVSVGPQLAAERQDGDLQR